MSDSLFHPRRIGVGPVTEEERSLSPQRMKSSETKTSEFLTASSISSKSCRHSITHSIIISDYFSILAETPFAIGESPMLLDVRSVCLSDQISPALSSP